MSKLDEQEVAPTKSPKGEREGTSTARKAPGTVPRQLASATRIVQLLPDRTRTRKGSFTHSELKKSDSAERLASPKRETAKVLFLPDLATPIITVEDETGIKAEETPTTIISEGRPKRNTPKLRRFIDDFIFLIKPPTTHSKPPMKPILNENGVPVKRGRGRPSNRERLEAQLLASQRMGIQGSGEVSNQPTSISQEVLVNSTKVVQDLVDLDHERSTKSTPKQESAVLQKPRPAQEPEEGGQGDSPLPDSSDKKHHSPHSQKQKQNNKSRMRTTKYKKKKLDSDGQSKSGNDPLPSMEKENACEQQPPKRKRGRPRKHPLPETPNVPGERSKSLPAFPRTPSSKQKGGKNVFKRKSLPQNSIPKHRKAVTIADLITESESTDKSDQEDSVLTSGDEQTDTTFRASNVRISPTCKAYHPVLNPLPGFVDAITCTEVVRPAISPYGHVLSWETWIKVLCFGDPKNVCPFTKRPLTKRQLELLDFDNIEEFRHRIQNI